MTEEKKDLKTEQEKPKMRQIIIETDGNVINIIKAEVAGAFEFKGILETVLNNLSKQQ